MEAGRILHIGIPWTLGRPRPPPLPNFLRFIRASSIQRVILTPSLSLNCISKCNYQRTNLHFIFKLKEKLQRTKAQPGLDRRLGLQERRRRSELANLRRRSLFASRSL